MRKVWGFVLATVAGLVSLFAFSSQASATTFCVPAFSAACTDNGTNQARALLSTAVTELGNDGQADKVIVAPGTLTESGSISASGNDPLEITGAGRDQTFVTTSATGNIFLLNSANRPGMKLSDLTLVVPASFPDSGGNGAAAQIKSAELNRVDVEVRNSESDVFASLLGNNVIRDMRIYAIEGAKVDWAFRSDSGTAAKTEIFGITIESPSYGFVVTEPNNRIEVSESAVIGPTSAGVWASSGGQVILENTLIETEGTSPITASSTSNDPSTVVSVVSSTFISHVANSFPAIEVNVPASITAGNVLTNISSSIIRGFDETWDLSVPIGPGFPTATLNIGHSNFSPVAAPGSGGTANVSSPTNINLDPKFAGENDYRLLPDSPSIDTGNPALTLTTDLIGEPRPRDGNLDGSSIPDQGAYEFQPTCATVPLVCVDEKAPKISKVRFFSKPKSSSTVTCRVSEAAKVSFRFKPLARNSSKGKKPRFVKIVRQAKAGKVRVKVSKRKLRPGRYRLTIVATDKAGNTSKATRKVRVK